MLATLSDMATGYGSIFLSSDAADWVPVSPQLVFPLLLFDSSGDWYIASCIMQHITVYRKYTVLNSSFVLSVMGNTDTRPLLSTCHYGCSQSQVQNFRRTLGATSFLSGHYSDITV